MKRRTSPLPCRIMTYGLLTPSAEVAAVVDDQLRGARAYRNQLIDLELFRRAKYREVTGEHERLAPLVDQISTTSAQLATVRQQINEARADARRRVEKKELSLNAQQLRAELKALRVQHKAVRAEISEDPDIVAALDALGTKVNQMRKQARAQCRCYWGTYVLVEAAMEQARKAKMDPVFRRWDGSGRIGVQVQGGASTGDVLDGRCRLLQIEGFNPVAIQTRSGRRAKTSVKVQFRVGTVAGTPNPIWVTFEVKMHRALPADGTIKAAWIMRRRIGLQWGYTLQIVVEAASFERQLMPKSAPIMALHLGWRHYPEQERLRIGYLVDELGASREISLPTAEPSLRSKPKGGTRLRHGPHILTALAFCDRLRAIRDTHLDEFRPKLIADLKALEGPLPEWMAIDLQTMHAWRSHDRFLRFVDRWREERQSGDVKAFATALSWSKKEHHLAVWESNQRESAIRRRKDLYRNLAVELSRKYSLAVLEDFDLRKVARTAAPEDEEEAVTAMRRNRARAAPSELRNAISQRLPVTLVPTMDNTQRCHVCGSIQKFDGAVHIEHDCSDCGVHWDIDFNAAQNLLRRYREHGAEPTPGPARVDDLRDNDDTL